MRKIQELREAKGLSINYLADFSGVSRGHMSKLLAGHSSPTLRTLAKVAEALGTDVRSLFS